jgi:hypothetical protein
MSRYLSRDGMPAAEAPFDEVPSITTSAFRRRWTLNDISEASQQILVGEFIADPYDLAGIVL